MTQSGRYGAITPAWNEAENLHRLAHCLTTQRAKPARWVIVDTGSTDETLAVGEQLSTRFPWIEMIRSGPQASPRPGAPIVRAFHEGLKRLEPMPEFVVKLDADVSFDDDYFQRLLAAFDAQPGLGIASGGCLEQDEDGHWKETHVSRGHVRGATRVYRRACLRQVLPLEEHVGWDGIDGLKANLHGWTTGIVDDVWFFHHRSVGERDGTRSSRWKAQGRGAYYMGYRFPFLLFRSLHRARSDPAALWMIASYVNAAIRREQRVGDRSVREFLRRQQSLRRLPVRARAALRRT